MRIFDTYISSVKDVIHTRPLIGTLYLLLLVFALTVSVPFYNYLESSFSYSLEFDESVSGFDFLFIKDFIQEHKDGLGMFLLNLKWLIFLYFLMSVFLSSGIVSAVVAPKESYKVGAFFRDCTKYFWKYLRMAVYFILFYTIVFFLLFKLFEAILGGVSVFEIENDKLMIVVFYSLFGLFSLIFFLSILLQDLCKLDIAHNPGDWIYKNLLRSLKKFSSNYLKYIFYYLLILFSFVLISLIVYVLKQYIKGMEWLFVSFILGQIYIVLRIAIRLTKIFGLNYLYKN